MDNEFEGLSEFLTEIETQDNRSTRTPILITLQEKNRIFAEDEILGQGAEEGRALELFGESVCEDNNIDKDAIYWYTDIWEDKAWFFTYSAYEEHLRLNGHNYQKDIRSYVYCWDYRNPEISKIIGWLKATEKLLKVSV
jgi:hypothetical protein